MKARNALFLLTVLAIPGPQSFGQESSAPAYERFQWPAVKGTKLYKGVVADPTGAKATFVTHYTAILVPAGSTVTVSPMQSPRMPLRTSSSPALAPPESTTVSEAPTEAEKPAPPPPPAEVSPLPENPGPSASQWSVSAGIGHETFAVTGGLSDFESKAGIIGVAAQLLTRMDPSQDDRWAIGLDAALHPFRAEVEDSSGTASLQRFWRFTGDAFIAREMLTPSGHPSSLLLGVGTTVSRLPGFRVADVERGQGELEDKTWVGPLVRAAWSHTPQNELGWGASLNVTPVALNAGKGSLYKIDGFMRPTMLTAKLPDGYFMDVRGEYASESRKIDFACSNQPACKNIASTVSKTWLLGLTLGSEF